MQEDTPGQQAREVPSTVLSEKHRVGDGKGDQLQGLAKHSSGTLESLTESMARQEEVLERVAKQHESQLADLSRRVEEHFAFLELRLQETRTSEPREWGRFIHVKPPPVASSQGEGLVTPPEVPCPQLPSIVNMEATESTGATGPRSSERRSEFKENSLAAGSRPSTNRRHVEMSQQPTSFSANFNGAERSVGSASVSKMSRFRKGTEKIKAFDDAEESRRKYALEVGTSFRGTSSPHQQDEDEDEEENSVLQTLVRSSKFDAVCATVVAVNAIFMGVAVEELYYKGEISLLSEIMEGFFLVFYTCEIALRAYVAGWRDFIMGKDCGWNLTDTLIVVVSVIYRLLQGTSRSFTVVRILRNLRMIRVLRVVRVTRFFKQLRMLVHAIASTLKTCMWTILLLCVFVYMFAIAIGQMVAYHMEEEREAGQGVSDDLDHYFNNLAECVFTLFMSVSGGIDWESAVRPLFAVGWPCVALFLLYIVVVVLCIMNLMTGIFVESAMDAAQSDKEHVINCELEEASKYKKSLTDLFEKWDVSGDHNLTIAEFEKHLADGRVKALFRTLEIDPSDAWTFFKLLDKDSSGIVSLDEFIGGCVKLKGGATGFHMERIQYETRWLMDITTEIFSAVSELYTLARDSKDGMSSQGLGRVLSKGDRYLDSLDEPKLVS